MLSWVSITIIIPLVLPLRAELLAHKHCSCHFEEVLIIKGSSFGLVKVLCDKMGSHHTAIIQVESIPKCCISFFFSQLSQVK
jgi:hypothetical protein